MLNSINLLGRLVKDPELRKTNSDVSFATFTLAVDNSVKEADGTRGTCFLDCRIYREAAENLVKFVRKGNKVAVSGSINQRNFERKDGTKGKAYEIIVDAVEYLTPKSQEQLEDEILDDEDCGYDSCGSLDGEKYTDKDGKEHVLKAVPPEPKFDPMTGKPLKPSKK